MNLLLCILIYRLGILTSGHILGLKKGDPTTKIKFSIDPYLGLDAVVRGGEGKMYYIDLYTKDNAIYIVYDRKIQLLRINLNVYLIKSKFWKNHFKEKLLQMVYYENTGL